MSHFLRRTLDFFCAGTQEGVWVFDVQAGEGQSLKTANATRLVPIRSETMKHGFLDYWKALPDGQLWPALRPGGPDGKFTDYFVKRFVTYRRKCGVTAPRKAFHSFRKNAAQASKDARATPAEVAELIGHEQGFILATYAPMELPVMALRELFEKIQYEGLSLDHLYI
jgi:hypothetical protein